MHRLTVRSRLVQHSHRLSGILLLTLPTAALANITELDVQDILTNLQTVLNPALRLLLAVSFVIGVWFCLKGLLKLKAFALPLTQTTQPGELSGPIMNLLIGAVLIYIPTSTDVLSATFFGGGLKSLFSAGGAPNVYALGSASSQLMGYSSVSLESQWATLIDTVVYYMQFIGFLAFLRGWIILSHSVGGHGQPEKLSTGIVHIVGGILAINFLPLVHAVSNTISGGA